MIYLLFFAELIILFILSQALSKSFSQAFYRLFRSQKMTVYLLAIFFFPGVVVHEISHWLMAQLLFVPTGRVEFMPVLRGTELKLGSVAVAQTDPIRRALIGVAPFLVGTMIILLALFFYGQLTLIPENLKIFIVGYVVFEIGNTMFSSRKDLEGTVELLLTIVILSIILYFIGVRIPDGWIIYLNSDSVISVVRQSSYFIGIPLVLDIVLILILRFFLRIAK